MNIERYDEKISRIEYQMDKMLEQHPFSAFFSSRYRNRRMIINSLEKKKELISKEVEKDYKKLKVEQRKSKEAEAELKNFEKFVNTYVRKHSTEIQFIIYCKKNVEYLRLAYDDNLKEELDK